MGTAPGFIHLTEIAKSGDLNEIILNVNHIRRVETVRSRLFTNEGVVG